MWSLALIGLGAWIYATQRWRKRLILFDSSYMANVWRTHLGITQAKLKCLTDVNRLSELSEADRELLTHDIVVFNSRVPRFWIAYLEGAVYVDIVLECAIVILMRAHLMTDTLCLVLDCHEALLVLALAAGMLPFFWAPLQQLLFELKHQVVSRYHAISKIHPYPRPPSISIASNAAQGRADGTHADTPQPNYSRSSKCNRLFVDGLPVSVLAALAAVSLVLFGLGVALGVVRLRHWAVDQALEISWINLVSIVRLTVLGTMMICHAHHLYFERYQVLNAAAPTEPQLPDTSCVSTFLTFTAYTVLAAGEVSRATITSLLVRTFHTSTGENGNNVLSLTNGQLDLLRAHTLLTLGLATVLVICLIAQPSVRFAFFMSQDMYAKERDALRLNGSETLRSRIDNVAIQTGAVVLPSADDKYRGEQHGDRDHDAADELLAHEH